MTQKKLMISVIRGVTGIISMTMFQIGPKSNRNLFEQNALGDLASENSTQCHLLHIDNARPQLISEKLKVLGIKRLYHPPYSLT